MLHQPLSIFERFRRMLQLDKRDITQVYTYAIFNGLVNLSLPLGIQYIINLIQGGSMSFAWGVLVIFVIIGYSLTGFFQFMQLRIVENISQKIFFRSSFEFAYRFPKIKFKSIYFNYAPELANRFFDTLTIQKSLPKLLIDFSLASFQIIIGVLVLCFYHSFFVFYGILLLILIYLFVSYIGPRGLKTSLQESKYKYKMVYWLEEVARAKVSFKMAPNNQINLSKTDEIVEEYVGARESHFKVLVNQFILLIVFKVLIAAGLLIIGSVLVFNQQMNIGQFVAAEIIILLVIGSVEKIIQSLDSIYDMFTAIEKIGYVTDMPLDKDSGHKCSLSNLNGIDIQLQNVSYHYADDRRKSIKNTNLEIKRGEKVTIYGDNGSGKSTLMNLLSCLFDPTEGSILFNGVNSHSVDLDDLRQNTGYVFSRNEIFAGTILENVTLGRENVSIQSVVKALEAVQLKNYIGSLEKGLDTPLDPEGKRLAMSVVQKLVIARAIVTNPNLLIMDEPLETIDTEDKAMIMKYLTDPENHWTLIVLSSDPTWIGNCQKVLELTSGKLSQN
jgi:ABC-type bacteriocin/lantibiotic exporter with double-glycine peptidase domain